MIALLRRDLALALRSGGGFGLSLAFFLIVVMFVPFGVGPDSTTLALIAPGILWIGALLACLLSLDRIFQLDYEDGSLDLLATSPLPLEGIVVMKALAHWLTTGLPLTLAAPLLGFLLNLPDAAYLWVFLSLLVGTPALSCLGAFGAAITVGLKRGGLLLSLLVLPLYIPTLIFGAQSVVLVVRGLDNQTAFVILAAISLFTFALVPFAAARALKVNLK
ncbi:MAG: heme exporter protein CcmB [Rhodobacteraceae bacterium]|nr:heme exporter protein CcmB [Paracoccaceae bacterium]MCB1368963.1 heme exporter protein CcmB [Paracoccaceae bacterium]